MQPAACDLWRVTMSQMALAQATSSNSSSATHSSDGCGWDLDKGPQGAAVSATTSFLKHLFILKCVLNFLPSSDSCLCRSLPHCPRKLCPSHGCRPKRITALSLLQPELLYNPHTGTPTSHAAISRAKQASAANISWAAADAPLLLSPK